MASPIQRGLKNILQKNPADVVFLSALRTPITRASKGGLKDAHDHELLYHVLRATLDRFPNLDSATLEDITVGTVLSELGGSKAGRMAALQAGWPETAGFSTMNRACASGLSAITAVAHQIALGSISIGIGGGMESMSRNYGSRAIPTALWSGVTSEGKARKEARDCVMSMGITAENVAQRYGVSRAEQDAFAARSQEKAVRAQENGWFEEEIVAVKSMWRDPKVEGAEAVEVLVERDDGVRKTSLEKLRGMKSAFMEGGTATAGNSSQISDGAGAALMMRRSTADALGMEREIIGKWAGTQTVGCRPDEMGVGPALAIPRLLEYTDVRREDVDIWEINEAFAAQAVYCIRELGLPEEKVNPKGGAIALGHPLGATGARMLATMLTELKRLDQRVGVMSMCVGTGMGSAALIVRE